MAAANALAPLHAPAAYAAAPASSPTSNTTIERYLGATKAAIEELEAHEADDFYLGTPYGTVGPNQFSPDLSQWDCWHPNGRPSSGGDAYMNCTGFVVAVLEACGADCDIVGSYVDATGYDYGNKSNLSRWRHFLDEHASLRTRYESKQELLESGHLRKGDLIMAEPNDWSTPDADDHIMFFWGDSSDEDRAWHSSSKGDGVVAGKAPGNMISRITAKTANCYWLHVPLTNLIEVIMSKTSANIDLSGASGANPAYSLAGAEFSVYRSYENGQLSDLIATFKTDEDGRATVEMTPGETVWVKEDVPPKGFSPWDEPKKIVVGQTAQEAELEDEPCAIDVIVVKEDEETGAHAQGWATLEGAVYELEDANGRTHRAQTAWDNERNTWAAMFRGIPRGAARIREAVPPLGYLLDESGDEGWHEIDLSPDSHEAVFTVELDPHQESVIHGDIVGGKFKENAESDDEALKSPLAGCVFAIWMQDDGSLESKGYEVTTIVDAENDPVKDANGDALEGVLLGEIQSHEDGRFDTRDLLASWNPEDHGGLEAPEHALPYGTYTLIEMSCPDPSLRLVEPITGLEVRCQGQEVFLMLEDERIASPVRVRKVDALTGKPVLKPGTTVELLKETGGGAFEPVEFPLHYPIEETVSTFVIDERGYVWFPDELAWGTYAIREVAAVPPYVLSDEAVVFQVDEHHEWGDEGSIEVVLENEAATGAIKGHKVDAEDGRSIAGAEYEVRAAHDVTMPDGTLALSAGDIAGRATTDDEGTWRVEGLPLGDGAAIYEVRETVSPDGYQLDDTVYTVTLEYADAETPVVERPIDFAENPTRIIIKKTDAETAEGIEGVEFSLFTVEDARSTPDGEKSAVGQQSPENADTADGEGEAGLESEQSAPLAVCDTDSEGCAYALRLPCDATYAIRETKARGDLGYVSQSMEIIRYLSPEGYWFESKDAYESDEADRPLPNEITVENDFTKITIFKVDSTKWSDLKEDESPTDTRKRMTAEQSAYLTGGQFRLLDGDGLAVPVESAQETWSAAGTQPQTFTHLSIGETFTVREESAPAGYRAGRDVSFVVKATEEVQTIVVGNERIESLPRTFDGQWKVAAGFGMAAVGGAALAAYSRRRMRVERLSQLPLARGPK